MNFNVKTSPIDNGEHCWKSTLVEIFHHELKIGQFKRNYSAHGAETFYPFERDGKWYALYSEQYDTLSVMELPSCKHIGSSKDGFCPIEVFVPTLNDVYGDNSYDDYDEQIIAIKERIGKFAFVSGCHWGDDSSMKICYVDLNDLKNPVVSYKFGYIEQMDKLTLKQSIEFNDFFGDENYQVRIASATRIDIDNEYYLPSPIRLSSATEKLSDVDALKSMSNDLLIKRIAKLEENANLHDRERSHFHNFKYHLRQKCGDEVVEELSKKAGFN